MSNDTVAGGTPTQPQRDQVIQPNMAGPKIVARPPSNKSKRRK